jgi:hypothetical protein
VMSQLGRLIGDVFASIGVVLAIAGIGLLLVQYLVWLKTDVWHPMHIRTVFEPINVSNFRAIDPVLESPLWAAVFIVGFVFVWIAAEIYEHHARSLRGKTNV